MYTDNHYIWQCDERNEKEANQVTAGQENGRGFHGGNDIAALGDWGRFLNSGLAGKESCRHREEEEQRLRALLPVHTSLLKLRSLPRGSLSQCFSCFCDRPMGRKYVL